MEQELEVRMELLSMPSLQEFLGDGVGYCGPSLRGVDRCMGKWGCCVLALRLNGAQRPEHIRVGQGQESDATGVGGNM